MFLFALTLKSQGVFKGVVLEDSVTRTPVYQAKVSVRENNIEVARLLTYFDGSFTYPTQKGKVYEFTASVPGTKDVSVSVVSDKRGMPAPASHSFVMRRDGLRLVGRVKDAVSGMPIDKAEVVLKDVQTREETRFTTNIDGLYNLKLKYETNYRVSIDKRSPGIVNRYEDTVFFVTTIGFNQPLDYELDIALRRAQQLTNRTEYVPQPSKPATKPVVEVKVPAAEPSAKVQAEKEASLPPKTTESVKPKSDEQPKKDEVKATPKVEVEKKSVPAEQPVAKQQKPKKQKEEKKVDETKEAIKQARVLEKENKKKKRDEDKSAAKQPAEKPVKPSKQPEQKAVAQPLPPQPQPAAPRVEKVEEKVVERLEEKLNRKAVETQLPPPPPTIIYFAKNAAYITDFSKSKLLPLIEQLKANPKLKANVNVHAGKDEANPDELCNKRNTLIKQFFAQNGIGAERFAIKNNGASQPANDCHVKGGCAEQVLILNRRIEIVITE